MIKIVLRRPDNAAYIINEIGEHCICTGFHGDELEYSFQKQFPLNQWEREMLGTLGIHETLSKEPEEAERQQMLFLELVTYKTLESKWRKPAPDVNAEIPKLVQAIHRVTEECPKWEKRSLERPWYMMNLGNPVVDKLKERFCIRNGISRHFPLSDEERRTFELQMLHPGVLSEVKAAVLMAAEDNEYLLKSTR